MIIRICPITGGIPTTMRLETFDRQCKWNQRVSREATANGTQTNTYCSDECRGRKPMELTIKKFGEMMDMGNMGTCNGCGRSLTIKRGGLCACCDKKKSHGQLLPLETKVVNPKHKPEDDFIDPTAAAKTECRPDILAQIRALVAESYGDEKDKIISKVMAELASAETRYPEWPADVVHQVAIMAEEAGEAVQAANNLVHHGKGDVDLIKGELVQTAAMAIRCLANL